MNINVKQHDIKDCGAACLASVAAHYKLKVPIARIRQYAHTDKRGTNVLGIIEGANKLGFTAKGVKGGMDAMPNIPVPTIAHIVIDGKLQHFVVVYKVTGKYVHVMNPGVGKMEKYPYEKWEAEWSGVLVLLEPNETFTTGDSSISIYRRFWNLVKPHKTVLTESLVGAIVYTVLGLSMSIYIEKITDYVLVDGNTNLLNLMSFIMLIILAIKIFINVVKSKYILRTGQKMDAQLILGYYKHLLQLPQRFFDTMRVGEITSRISDAVKIRAFINDAAIEIFVNIFIVIFAFALMFTYYWKLALIVALIIPGYIILYIIMNYLNKKVERRMMEDAAELESQLVESLNGVKTIKQFGVIDYNNFKTELRFNKLLKSVFKSTENSIFSINTSEVLTGAFVIILLWQGSYYVIQKEITTGELLSFYALIGYFTGPVASLVEVNKMIQNALIAAERLFEIMDLEQEEVSEKFELSTSDLGDISFNDVDFSYGTRIDVFEQFSLTIKKGQLTAVVGESGSGKTTIVSLIQNLYPLSNGTIRIGEYDLKYISNSSLRSLIGVVPQNLTLFSGNVIENIAFGSFEPDFKYILELCKMLGMTEFIEKLPKGFQTHLGENGALLSSGQKQRIAIARALYKKPEIIIFDEATSSLDSTSEKFIQKVLQLLRKEGRTIIVIAHRLSTIINADTIVVLEEGKLVEQGLHEQLLSNNSFYHKLWTSQYVT